MLGLTGDPVRQARHGCPSTKQDCMHPGSRAVCRTASYNKRHKAASTSHQAATAFAGGHGAGPCASAAAAAAAPTAMQDLLVQVAHEEPAHRYAQHTVDLSSLQLHQLQRHDQVLLQQQLEHLHLQHQHRQQQQQQEQQEQQHTQQLPQQGSTEGLEPLPTAQGNSSAAPVQQHPVVVKGQPLTSWHGGCNALEAEHYAQQDAAPQLQPPLPQHQQQLTADCVEQPGGGHGTDLLHSNGSARGMRSSAAMPASSRGRPQQVAAVSLGTAHAVLPPSQHAQWNDPRPADDAALQHSSKWESLQHQQPKRVQHQQLQPLERTPAGLPLVRLHRGCKPAQVAELLCSCLLQEQPVVLSAAGADLALMALSCLERAVVLQQQRQPGSLVLAAPSFRTSRRPVGGGRCQVYDLVCSLHTGVLQQEQEQQGQYTSQASRASQLQEQPAALQCNQQQSRRQQQQAKDCARQQQQQRWQQYAEDEGMALTGVGVQHNSCCSSDSMLLRSTGVQHAQAGAHSAFGRYGGRQQPHQQPDWRQQQQQQYWQPVGGGHQLSPTSQLLLQHVGDGHGRQRQQQQRQQDSLLELTHMQQEQFVTAQQMSLLAEQQGWQQHEHAGDPSSRRSSSSSMSAAHAGHLPPLEAASAPSGDTVPGAAVNSQVGPAAAAAAADMAAAAPVAVVKVAGSSINFADSLEDALTGPVMLPVAHAKQAVRVLEAVSLVSTRLQQRQQRQGWRAQLAEQQAGATSSSSAVGMQLVIQPRRGKVRGQSGSLRGLHVFVYAAPLV